MFLGLAVTRFNPPLTRNWDKIDPDKYEQHCCLQAAAAEYDRVTASEDWKEQKVQKPVF